MKKGAVGMRVTWSNLTLGGLALLARARARTAKKRGEKSRKKDGQGTALTTETLVAVVVASVSKAVAEVLKPFTEVVANNTAAVHALLATLAEQNEEGESPDGNLATL